MKTPFLTFKSAIVLSLIAGAFYGLQSLADYITEAMVPAVPPMACTYTGPEYNDAKSGMLAGFKCGEKTIVLSSEDTLKVLTKNITEIQCSSTKGAHSGETKWKCEV